MSEETKKGREATLRDFIGFIKKETDLVNDPLLSKGSIKQYQEKKSTTKRLTKERHLQCLWEGSHNRLM